MRNYRFPSVMGGRQRGRLQAAILATPAGKNGGCHAVDNLRGFDSVVAVGISHFLHHGWADPYSARNSGDSGAGAHHSRTEAILGLPDSPAPDDTFRVKLEDSPTLLVEGIQHMVGNSTRHPQEWCLRRICSCPVQGWAFS